MKKKESPASEARPAAADAAPALAPIIPLRTETVLSRYPLHQLAKKGKIAIRQTTQNARTKVETTWEVRHAPGALGYKIDALVISRRIDELRSRGELRPLIKIGSLREICEELGLNPNSGKNTNAVKEALRENAAAFVICGLNFKDNEGKQREFEFNDTRYAVYFVGETLPNGEKADAVYIQLHDAYYNLLQHAKTRPLDYAYARTLAPAPHRLYELLSFPMFGALKHEQPIAYMLYSEFCAAAPLTRHLETRKMHAQMWKIHQPHLKDGYFEKVTFARTTDTQGKPDWLMKYTPGPRAQREHALFTKKQLAAQEQAAPRLLPPPAPAPTPKPKPAAKAKAAPKAAPPPPAPQPADPADLELLAKLMEYGVERVCAATLVLKDRAECELWAAAWPYQNQKGMDNPPAVLISFISKKRRPLPPGYEQAQQRQAQQQQAAARARTQEEYEAEYQTWLTAALAQLPEHDPAAYTDFSAWFASLWPLIKDCGAPREIMEPRVFRDFAKEHPRLRRLGFAQWLAQHYPTAS